MNHKPYLIILFCALLTLSVAAQKDTRQQQKDSLLQVIEQTDGEERTRARKQLVSLYYMELKKEGVRDTIMALFDDIAADADSRGNIGAREVTKLNKLQVLFNMLLFDEVIEKAPLCVRFPCPERTVEVLLPGRQYRD